MFAKEIELNLVDDLTESALVELNAADVDDVSGAVIPLVVWGLISIATGAGAGAGIGYLINRR